jgi:predicted HicB family RNase H-like nuclease
MKAKRELKSQSTNKSIKRLPIDLDSEMHRDLKMFATQEGISMVALVRNILEKHIYKQKK